MKAHLANYKVPKHIRFVDAPAQKRRGQDSQKRLSRLLWGSSCRALGPPTSVELHYQKGGVAAEEAVVFVNGLTMDTTAWEGVERGILPTPTPRCATTAADKASRTSPRGLTRRTRARGGPQNRFVGRLQGSHRIHLVGLSNGGLISILLAGDLASAEPERVRSVTTVDSFVRVDPMLRDHSQELASGI